MWIVSWEHCSGLCERSVALWCPLYNEASYWCSYLHKALHEIIISSGTSFYVWSGPGACNAATLGSSWIPSPENTLLKGLLCSGLVCYSAIVVGYMFFLCGTKYQDVIIDVMALGSRDTILRTSTALFSLKLSRMWSAFCSLLLSLAACNHRSCTGAKSTWLHPGWIPVPVGWVWCTLSSWSTC